MVTPPTSKGQKTRGVMIAATPVTNRNGTFWLSTAVRPPFDLHPQSGGQRTSKAQNSNCVPGDAKRGADRDVMMKEFAEIFARSADQSFTVKYRASCHCNAIQYQVCADPVDSKICHCRVCQTLHGAPMQWAAIFHKHHVRITEGINLLRFYNSEFNKHERILPSKVSCSLCGAFIADEGRHMWLAFPSLFDFGIPPKVPELFKPTCHIFYGMRMIDLNDDLPKWSGHKNKSVLL